MTRARAALEERVGARPVERTTRRLTPTEAGRRLGEPARRALRAYDETSSITRAPRSRCV